MNTGAQINSVTTTSVTTTISAIQTTATKTVSLHNQTIVTSKENTAVHTEYKIGDTGPTPSKAAAQQPCTTEDMAEEQSKDPVMKMLQAMNNKLSSIQNDIQDLKTNQNAIRNDMTGIMYDQEDDREMLITHQAEIRSCQDQVTSLACFAKLHEDEIEELNNKIVQMEANQMKNELLIFGIDAKEGETCAALAKDFFENKMEINNLPLIMHAYWKGKSQGRPMVGKTCQSNS